jgi:flagellar hook-length control protein FliK
VIIQEAFSSNDRRGDDHRVTPRPAYQTQSGPIGFGQVLRQARRSRSTDGNDPTLASILQAAAFDRSMITGAVIDQQRTDAIAQSGGAHARTTTSERMHHSLQMHAPHLSHAPRVTPERAMELIQDVTREMEGASGVRELHLELEPEHLGPLVASIMIDRGRITVRMRTKQADAATTLARGADTLRDRLAALGFAQARVQVEQDSTLELPGAAIEPS